MDYGRITPLIVKAVQDIANLSATFRNSLVAWLADAQNGIAELFAMVGDFGRVNTSELCVDDVCVTRDEFLRMREGQAAAADTSGTPIAEVPGGSPTSVAADADATPATTPSLGASSTPETLSPQPTEPVEEAPAAEPEAANDNSPAEPLPATATQ